MNTLLLKQPTSYENLVYQFLQFIKTLFTKPTTNNMRTITINYRKLSDTERITLAMNVIDNMRSSPLYKGSEKLMERLEQTALELEDELHRTDLDEQPEEVVTLTKLRYRLHHYLDYAATTVRLKAFENLLKRNEILDASGFAFRKEREYIKPLIAVRKGKQPLSATVLRKAEKGAIYVFNMSADGKRWEQKMSTRSSFTFERLQHKAYYFRVAIIKENVQSDFSECIRFWVE